MRCTCLTFAPPFIYVLVDGFQPDLDNASIVSKVTRWHVAEWVSSAALNRKVQPRDSQLLVQKNIAKHHDKSVISIPALRKIF